MRNEWCDSCRSNYIEHGYEECHDCLMEYDDEYREEYLAYQEEIKFDKELKKVLE